VPPNGVQVQRAADEQILSATKKRLFDVPNDSQSVINDVQPDDVLSSDSEVSYIQSSSPVEEHICGLCHRVFLKPYLLTKHLKVCRKEGTKRVQVVSKNGWTCSICKETGQSLSDFKKHIFYQHGEK